MAGENKDWWKLLGAWNPFGGRGPTAPASHNRPASFATAFSEHCDQLERGRAKPDYPNTFVALSRGDQAGRPVYFDPALQHIVHGFRHGDPVLADLASRVEWQKGRRLVTAGVLRSLVESSELSEHLALRGSLLLKCWCPDVAREPGDLDFVVVPSTIGIQSDAGDELVGRLMVAIRHADVGGRARLMAGQMRSDVIWTYCRVPGLRFVVPWQVDELPVGMLQIDLVFEEAVPENAFRRDRPVLPDGSEVSCLVATPEMSLIWKLQWLLTDAHAQGKDLYDAVVLSRIASLSVEELDRQLRSVEPQWDRNPLSLGRIRELRTEWKHFEAEYPWIGGTEREWLDRLIEGVRPAFERLAAS
jgi:hypothetical protein